MAAVTKDYNGFIANLPEREKQIYAMGADGKRQVPIFTCPILETEDDTIQNAFSIISETFGGISSSWDIIPCIDRIQLIPSSYYHFLSQEQT